MKTKKRKQLSVLAVFLTFFLSTMTYGQTTTKTITLNYSESDFNFEYNDSGRLFVSSPSLGSWFSEDVESPALPYFSFYVLVGPDEVFDTLSIHSQGQTAMTGVAMAHNPVLQPAGAPSTELENILDSLMTAGFCQTSYPNTTAVFTGTHVMNGYRMMSFRICPYVYNVQDSTLNLLTSITLTIYKHTDAVPNPSLLYSSSSENRERVVDMVINPEDVFTLYPLPMAQTSNTIILGETPVEYLIVTTDSLVTAFKEIAEWKTMKGIRGKIITIQEIYAAYSGDTPQQKIKNCLYDYYHNGMKFVLLGGDDTIVPVPYCYSEISITLFGRKYISAIEENMPTDLYYCCFDGNFSWDENQNGIYGEVEDNTDLFPEILLTRIPVRTAADVRSFVKKIIVYEQNPPANDFDYGLLMCGMKTFDNGKIISDSYKKSKYIYNNCIAPYWDGNVTYVFDTYSDSNHGGFSYSSLLSELNSGYTFVDVTTHGGEYFWVLESGGFPTNAVSGIHSPHPMIIKTMSCNTNAFDSTIDPCLSEAFLRSPDSGVIGYIGCSKDGLENRDSTLGPASRISEEYYRQLFRDETPNSFGGIVSSMKSMYASRCNDNNADRWMLYCVNSMGDPEMPVYKIAPDKFTDNPLRITADSLLTFSCGTSGCLICIKEQSERGDSSYYRVCAETAEIPLHSLPNNVSVCITKEGFVPWVGFISKGDPLYIQNVSLASPYMLFAGLVHIGSHVTGMKPSGPVIIEKEKTEIKTSKGVVINGEFEVKRGAEFSIEIGQLPW